VSSYPITGEIYAAGYRWREEFETVELLEANGGSLQGAATIGADGLVLDGGAAGWADFDINPTILNWHGRAFLVIEFTPDFEAAEAVSRILLDTTAGAGTRIYVRRRNVGTLQLFIGAVLLFGTAGGAWQPLWRPNDRNTLIYSLDSGVSNTAWLNGTQIDTNANAWSITSAAAQMTVGSALGGLTPWSGSVRRVHIGRGTLEQSDVDHLHAGDLMTSISPSEYLLALPCDETHVEGADTVTRAVGTSGIPYAVLGAGVAQPSGPEKRLFSFDGGDVISISSRELLQFTEGGVDVPFTVFCVFQPPDGGAARGIVSKASAFGVGEWYVFINNVGGLYLRIVDNTTGGYIGRRITGVGALGGITHAVLSYDGSGAETGICVIALNREGFTRDDANANAGAFTRMRATAEPLLLGSGPPNPMSGYSGLWGLLRGVAASPMQARALAQRLRHYRRADDTSAP
jgi:hypothetical protein